MAVSLGPVAPMSLTRLQKSWPPSHSAVNFLRGRETGPAHCHHPLHRGVLRPRREEAGGAELHGSRSNDPQGGGQPCPQPPSLQYAQV